MPAQGTVRRLGRGWFEGISKNFAGDKSDLAQSDKGMDSPLICKWRAQNKTKRQNSFPEVTRAVN